MYRMAARLCSVNSLYFPTALLHAAPSRLRRKTALLELLSCDAPLFIEQYGCSLHPDEFAFFDMLRDDYEVCSHLSRLRASASWKAGSPHVYLICLPS